jgi:hypothetical protein
MVTPTSMTLGISLTTETVDPSTKSPALLLLLQEQTLQSLIVTIETALCCSEAEVITVGYLVTHIHLFFITLILNLSSSHSHSHSHSPLPLHLSVSLLPFLPILFVPSCSPRMVQ